MLELPKPQTGYIISHNRTEQYEALLKSATFTREFVLQPALLVVCLHICLNILVDKKLISGVANRGAILFSFLFHYWIHVDTYAYFVFVIKELSLSYYYYYDYIVDDEHIILLL